VHVLVGAWLVLSPLSPLSLPGAHFLGRPRMLTLTLAEQNLDQGLGKKMQDPSGMPGDRACGEICLSPLQMRRRPWQNCWVCQADLYLGGPQVPCRKRVAGRWILSHVAHCGSQCPKVQWRKKDPHGRLIICKGSLLLLTGGWSPKSSTLDSESRGFPPRGLGVRNTMSYQSTRCHIMSYQIIVSCHAIAVHDVSL